jgi:putrescine transport system ATP-binding protein
MTVADRIAVMDHGKLIQVSTPAEIYEQPNSRYVADFIGDVNIVEGRIATKGDGVVTIASDAAALPIRIATPAETTKDQQVWLAIRPEKVRIATERPAATENVIEGTVWDIAYLGDLSIYKVKLANGVYVKSAQTNVSRLIERPISWEDKVWLSFAPDAGVVLTR